MGSYSHPWAGDRVYFQPAPGRLRSLPGGRTSLALRDPFVIQADGKSWFRVVEAKGASRQRRPGLDERRDPMAVPPAEILGFGHYLAERLIFPSVSPPLPRIL